MPMVIFFAIKSGYQNDENKENIQTWLVQRAKRENSPCHGT
jgi:hypothetical protein